MEFFSLSGDSYVKVDCFKFRDEMPFSICSKDQFVVFRSIEGVHKRDEAVKAVVS